jgi:hypothetical protein
VERGDNVSLASIRGITAGEKTLCCRGAKLKLSFDGAFIENLFFTL